MAKAAAKRRPVVRKPEDRPVDAILHDIARGEPTYKAAPAHGVPFGTFWGWVSADADLAEKYARAKQAGLERMAEEIVAIADEARAGTRTTTKADGSAETVEVDLVERSKLQIDARKWLLAKLAPKKYGEKLDVELGGNVYVTINESDA